MLEEVNILIQREVLPGELEQFREASLKIKDAVSMAKGFISHNYQESDDGKIIKITVVFDSLQHAKLWEDSQEKSKLLKRLNNHSVIKSKLYAVSGLETWFLNYNGEVKTPPPKHKMALITWIAVTPLLILVSLALKPLLHNLSIPVRIFCTTPFVVIIMTYFLMPFMAKLFSKWLYPN